MGALSPIIEEILSIEMVRLWSGVIIFERFFYAYQNATALL